MAKKIKPFTDYIKASHHDGIREYFKNPVPTFFIEILDISDAFTLCLRRFSKKNNGEYTKASHSSQMQLSAACLCTIMGHFELYQRFTFAGLVEHSVYLDGFDLKDAIKRLTKEVQFQIDPSHLLAYRSEASVVGQMLVDNLPGWHDPRRVNSYFRSIRPKMSFYSNDQVDDLTALWQLRHSIAHTGGWLSLPDSQKVSSLYQFRNKALYFEPQFIDAVVRRFHKIVPDCTKRLKTAFDENVTPEFLSSNRYQRFFEINSLRKSWL